MFFFLIYISLFERQLELWVGAPMYSDISLPPFFCFSLKSVNSPSTRYLDVYKNRIKRINIGMTVDDVTLLFIRLCHVQRNTSQKNHGQSGKCKIN